MTKRTRLTQLRTVPDFTRSLLRYLPGGRAFAGQNIPDEGMYDLHNGLGPTLFTVNEFIRDFVDERFPDFTQKFIEEHERWLGIPDGCFTIDGLSLDERRKQIIVKHSQLAIQTAADFEKVAAVFGVATTVLGGKDPSVSPVITPDKKARHTIVIQFVPDSVFPLVFPIAFGNSTIALLQCLFQNARPATCNVRFDSI